MSHNNSHLVRQKKTTVANKPASNSVSKNAAVISDNRPAQLKENKTGLPDTLKAGIENLGGMSMDHVKVHYNSGMPAQMQAHAYAQGSDIHVAPGQEKHLPHEAWHVVQQAKGRVKPTLHMGGVPVNNNKGLEKEADHMGAKALQTVQRYGPDPEEELANVMQRKEEGIAQFSGKGGSGGGKKGNNKKQEKQKQAAKNKASREQSQRDRNAFRALQYETTSKKDANAKQEAAKNIKGNLAHGFGNKGSGKQGKTKQQLKEINKEIQKQKEKEKEEKQKKADQAKKDWSDRSDRDDQGGAGFGHGVLVEAS